MSFTRRFLAFATLVPAPRRMTRIFGRLHASALARLGTRSPLSSDVLALTTIGRSSGLARATTVFHFDTDGRVYLAATYGGANRIPSWFHNLAANGRVSVEGRGIRGPRLARVLPAVERDALWPALDALYPRLATYRARTAHAIPIVELVEA